jgi:hypothetical protein
LHLNRILKRWFKCAAWIFLCACKAYPYGWCQTAPWPLRLLRNGLWQSNQVGKELDLWKNKTLGPVSSCSFYFKFSYRIADMKSSRMPTTNHPPAPTCSSCSSFFGHIIWQVITKSLTPNPKSGITNIGIDKINWFFFKKNCKFGVGWVIFPVFSNFFGVGW